MKKITLLLLVCSFFFACSNDDESGAGGELRLSGTIMAPNNAFPISRANVKVYKADVLISEKTTDALGAFEITDLPAGDLMVELSKGKFKKQIEIDLQSDYELIAEERNFDIFPNIAVVTGHFDEIEQVLINIGLVNPITEEPLFDIIDGHPAGRMEAPHDHVRQHVASRSAASLPSNVDFGFDELLNDPDLLDNYDIIFLNCGASEAFANEPAVIANLSAFVDNGGIIYATDWMYKYVQATFDNDEYLTFSQPEKAGTSVTAEAQVLNADLLAWLEAQGVEVNPSVQINDFLSAWQMVDTYNSANVMNWLSADVIYSGNPVVGKSLAFTFQYGEGGVFYSSFHTHGNESNEDAVVQMMNYFVFELSEL